MSSPPKKISPRKKIQKNAHKTHEPREPREPHETWFMDPFRLRSSDIKGLLDKPVTQGQRPPRGTPNIKRLREVLSVFSLGTDNCVDRPQLLKNLFVFLEDGYRNKKNELFSEIVAKN
jgi:hypothetical protein